MRPTPIRYATGDGLQIAYQVVGDGPVDLLYVPGHVNHIEAMWDVPELARFLERLAAFSRVILLDKRGTGLSDPMPGDQRATVEERMHDVWTVLEAVGSTSTSTFLFATADGTPVAMLAAAARPDRVRGLVLYASSARLRADDGYPGFDAAFADALVDGFRRSWASEDDDLGLRFVAPSVADDPRWRSSFARIQRRASTPRAAADYWRRNLDVDVRVVLPMVSSPTLVLHCTHDALYPIEQGRRVAGSIPGARFVELAGVDHFFFAENGERVADEVEEFVAGHRSGTTAQRRLAAVLFTDVVGSTERDVELGDRRWRALLEAHDEMTERLVERHRGTFVKSTGDGCLAVFDGPQGALATAAAIRDAAASLGLTLRAAVHAGEVEQRAGDVSGIAVHLAARVLGTAGPGDVVATRTVRDLVTGSELRFADHGTHELKGFDEPWQLYRLV